MTRSQTKRPGLPRTPRPEKAALVDTPEGKDWLTPAEPQEEGPARGAFFDEAIWFVEPYSASKRRWSSRHYFNTLTYSHYHKSLALLRTFARGTPLGKGLYKQQGKVLVELLSQGKPDYVRYWSGDSAEEFASFWRRLVAMTRMHPLPTKDFLPIKHSSLEASYADYADRLGRDPNTLSWLDKWNRAVQLEPIAGVLIRRGRAYKEARRLLISKRDRSDQKEQPDIDPVGEFLALWRLLREIRDKFVPAYKGKKKEPTDELRDRRFALARDLLTLALTSEIRAIFDAVGLWPSLTKVLVVEAWWLHVEHVAQRTSVPVDEIHYNVDSTFGVALLEAMKGAPVPAHGEPGYQHGVGKNGPSFTLPRLTVWRANTADLFWADLVAHSEAAVERPFILRHGVDKLAAAIGQDELVTSRIERSEFAVDCEELGDRWPRYPEAHHLPNISHDQWDQTGENRRFYKHARYTAQLKLFVAAGICNMATEDLGLLGRPLPLTIEEAAYNVDDELWKRRKQHRGKIPKVHWDRSDDESRVVSTLAEKVPLLDGVDPALLEKDELEQADIDALNAARNTYLEGIKDRRTEDIEPGAGQLRFVVGCFPWGGRKLPHKTHRDGLTFDLQMGSDTQQWPPTNEDVTRFLHAAIAINWPLLMPSLARGEGTKNLSASAWVQRLGKRVAERRSLTAQELNQGYWALARRYKMLQGTFPESLPYPLPLVGAARRRVQRFAFRLFRDNKRAEARALYELSVMTQLGEKLARRAVTDPLFVRPFSAEKKTFLGENRLVIFRSLLADTIVRPAISEVEVLVREVIRLYAEDISDHPQTVRRMVSSRTKRSIDPADLWRELELKLIDLPLPHSESGTQRGLLATLAILISGARNLTFGSPLLFVRALRMLVDRCAEDSQIGRVLLHCAGTVVQGHYDLCDFGFLPQNHHHHHHVGYSVQSYDAMYVQSKTWGAELELRDLEGMRETWLGLGIDLSRFLTYLKDEKRNLSGAPAAFQNERALVLKFVDAYVQEYEARYRTREPAVPSRENALAYQAFARARRRLYALLEKANSPELYRAKAKTLKSNNVRTLIETSFEIMDTLRPAIRFRALNDYLGRARRAGLAIADESNELWEDATLEEIVKNLQGPAQLRKRLLEVFDFLEPPESDARVHDEAPSSHPETDVEAVFFEEEMFRRQVYEELMSDLASP